MTAQLLSMPDTAFEKAWSGMKKRQRDALPPDVRERGYERYRKLLKLPPTPAPIAPSAPVTPIDKRAPRRGISAAELLATDFPDVVKVCGDFIPEGVTILAARPKAGKTTLARQAAEAVAIGGPFMDTTCESGEVLFLSLEEGDRLCKSKLRGMGLDPKAAARIDFHFTWPRGADGCVEIANSLQASPKVRLVIVDSLTRFRPQATDRNVTQFQADYESLAGLAGVAKARPGLAILVIHHSRKMLGADPLDDISGTHGLAAAADSYLVLRKEGLGATLHAGGRIWAREEADFNLRREGMRWQLDGVSDGLTDKERNVLDMVRGSGGMSPTELAKLLNISRQGCYNFLDALLAKGKVRKAERGYYVAL